MTANSGTLGQQRIAATFIAAIFVLSQCLSVIHAQHFGDDSHEHYGVECVFVAGAFDDDFAAAPAAFLAVAIAFIFAQSLAPARRTVRVHSARPQSPRAPPLR